VTIVSVDPGLLHTAIALVRGRGDAEAWTVHVDPKRRTVHERCVLMAGGVYLRLFGFGSPSAIVIEIPGKGGAVFPGRRANVGMAWLVAGAIAGRMAVHWLEGWPEVSFIPYDEWARGRSGGRIAVDAASLFPGVARNEHERDALMMAWYVWSERAALAKAVK
jgi:hypothetical protein